MRYITSETFLFDSVYGHKDTDWLCDVPSVFYGAQYKCLSYSYSYYNVILAGLGRFICNVERWIL